jgi:hypothetical protein
MPLGHGHRPAVAKGRRGAARRTQVAENALQCTSAVATAYLAVCPSGSIDTASDRKHRVIATDSQDSGWPAAAEARSA